MSKPLPREGTISDLEAATRTMLACREIAALCRPGSDYAVDLEVCAERTRKRIRRARKQGGRGKGER